MRTMKAKNAIYAQSGGVTSVINTTACAVIETARKSKKINKLYAGKDGIVGILNEDLIDTNLEDLKEIKKKTSLEPAAHLTCMGTSYQEIEKIAEDYWNTGVRHLVALRGDVPKEIDGNKQNDFKYATDLIRFLKGKYDFEITVSAYPEMHPDSDSLEQEYDVLKKKIDLGATKAITQFFFNVNAYFEFVDGALKRGINIPIIPGILPVTNCKRTLQFAKKMNCEMPLDLIEMFKGLDSDQETRKLVAVTIVYDQCRKLIDGGIEDFHFYTLNRADLSFAICHILGIRTLV